MSHFDTIKAPVVSEKAFAGIENGVYSFWVDPRVTKVEIKAAVEAVFGVKVDSVNTFAAPTTVTPRQISAKVDGDRVTMTVAPKSVTVISIRP